MSDTKLQAAKQKQEEYLFSWGHLEDVPLGDETFNNMSREIIAAYREFHGTAYLGKLLFTLEEEKLIQTGEGSIYTEYTGQEIPVCCCDFVLPMMDDQLESMVKEWAIDEWLPKPPMFFKSLNRIKELDGLTVDWR